MRRFTLAVADGTQSGRAWESAGDRCSIGSHPSNDLVLDEATVSRFHCEVTVDPLGARVRDLDSRNGTVVDGVLARDVYLRDGSLLRLGRTSLRFHFAAASNALPISRSDHFGLMVGESVPMRATFALLERAAATDSTILLEGETGTGKEAAAASIHEASARRGGPFVVVDCGAIPPNLIEAELFGHEKGAFTGAVARRVGAFEEATGGTVLLDEVGELPSELQPKLLRALEQRTVRRLGGSGTVPVDVRVIAATNRDLRVEVNQGRFRSDLYYRLAVVRVRLPALRERPEDIPLLIDRLLTTIGADAEGRRAVVTPELVATARHGAWPGNVRELRNYLERCLVFRQPLPLVDDGAGASTPPSADASRPAIDTRASYYELRRRAVQEWERLYLRALLGEHGGSVEKAARAAGIGRAYLYRLISRHR